MKGGLSWQCEEEGLPTGQEHSLNNYFCGFLQHLPLFPLGESIYPWRSLPASVTAPLWCSPMIRPTFLHLCPWSRRRMARNKVLNAVSVSLVLFDLLYFPWKNRNERMLRLFYQAVRYTKVLKLSNKGFGENSLYFLLPEIKGLYIKAIEPFK